LDPHNEDKSDVRNLLSEGRNAEEVYSLMRGKGWYSTSPGPQDEDVNNLFSNIANLLWDEEARIRGRASQVLCWTAAVYPQSWSNVEERVATRLLEMLSDSDPQVRSDVALAIVNAPSEKVNGVPNPEKQLIEKAIPLLISLLKDENNQVEIDAGWSLGNRVVDWILRNREDHKLVLDIQRRLARHREAANREHVASYWVWNARTFPEAAAKARPLLLQLAGDADYTVRDLAEKALSYLK